MSFIVLDLVTFYLSLVMEHHCSTVIIRYQNHLTQGEREALNYTYYIYVHVNIIAF